MSNQYTSPWTEKEDRILKEKYLDTPKKELLRLLPTRSWNAIRCEARKLGIRRDRSILYSGKNNGMYGKHHTKETRDKLSKRHTKFNITREELERLYWNENLSQREIGEKFNVSGSCIGWWMKKYKIPKRENKFQKGQTSWKKGKTKENNEIVRRSAEKLSRTRKRLFAEGKLKTWNKDKSHPKYGKYIEIVKESGKKNKGSIPWWIIEGVKNPSCTPEVKEKISKLRKEWYQDPEHRKLMSKIAKERWEDPIFREKIIKILFSEENIRKRMIGRQKHPNKPEKRTKYILDKYFPGEFGYNGNFELGIMIGGLIPDFPNVNGRKKIIEVFGDYWHDAKRRENLQWFRQEWGRKAYYSQFGWDCLIIWEHELVGNKFGNKLSEKEIVDRIKKFMEVK